MLLKAAVVFFFTVSCIKETQHWKKAGPKCIYGISINIIMWMDQCIRSCNFFTIVFLPDFVLSPNPAIHLWSTLFLLYQPSSKVLIITGTPMYYSHQPVNKWIWTVALICSNYKCPCRLSSWKARYKHYQWINHPGVVNVSPPSFSFLEISLVIFSFSCYHLVYYKQLRN